MGVTQVHSRGTEDSTPVRAVEEIKDLHLVEEKLYWYCEWL